MCRPWKGCCALIHTTTTYGQLPIYPQGSRQAQMSDKKIIVHHLNDSRSQRVLWLLVCPISIHTRHSLCTQGLTPVTMILPGRTRNSIRDQTIPAPARYDRT